MGIVVLLLLLPLLLLSHWLCRGAFIGYVTGIIGVMFQ
jgi:hypothetical protein